MDDITAILAGLQDEIDELRTRVTTLEAATGDGGQ